MFTDCGRKRRPAETLGENTSTPHRGTRLRIWSLLVSHQRGHTRWTIGFSVTTRLGSGGWERLRLDIVVISGWEGGDGDCIRARDNIWRLKWAGDRSRAQTHQSDPRHGECKAPAASQPSWQPLRIQTDVLFSVCIHLSHRSMRAGGKRRGSFLNGERWRYW